MATCWKWTTARNSRRLLTAAGKARCTVTRWQHSLHMVAFSLIANLVIGVAETLQGLPVAADVGAAGYRIRWSKSDRAVIAQLTTQGNWAETSWTPKRKPACAPGSTAYRREHLQAAGGGYPLPAWQHGQRVRATRRHDRLLDGIVNMAPDDAAPRRVFAHELEPCAAPAWLRTLIRTAAVSAVAACTSATSPVGQRRDHHGQLGYSRDFETEADDKGDRRDAGQQR